MIHRPARHGSARARTRMRRVQGSAAAARACGAWRRLGHAIAFVPTMGAIHEGHLSLVRAATRSADRVVASIFVNPLQFGPGEDFERYPRPRGRDHLLLRDAGVDLLWEPGTEELYPPGERTRVRVAGLDARMEGAARPGHFEGVTTVVAKLLAVVRPDVLWLGQKDAQQARLIEQMCRDLMLPVQVRRAPTVREPDGLAVSSRNAFLTLAQRAQAPALARGLAAALRLLREGERSAAVLQSAVRRVWRASPLIRADYVEVVDAVSLEPVQRVRGRILVAVAARIGKTRLIDNFEWSPR